MSEYWKSLPRKFCDICKCWFADNKASIEFHERGKRHQENAAKRIQDIQKRGVKEAKKQKQLEDDMAKIEKAALAAYKKDLQNLSGNHIETSISQTPSIEVPEIPKKKVDVKPIKKEKVIPKKKEDTPKTTIKTWYEAETEEGHKYYWNTEDSESQWEPPSEGYISIEEQNQSAAQVEETTIKKENSAEPVSSIGPQPKVDPYGQWVTIEHKEPEEIDLQLPKPSENIEEVVIPVLKDEPRLKIKEKVVGQLTDVDPSEEVFFKKRKAFGSSKRNTRQRTTDDD